MEEDPVFYAKISKLIEDAIADHRAKRLSDNDFLSRIQEAAEQVRRPQHDDVPEAVRSDDNAVAVFHVLGNAMSSVADTQGGNICPVLASAALELVGIVKDLKVVNWTENPDVQNAMRNRMDDYFFDVIRDQHGVQLEPDQIDVIVDSVLKVARARMAA